MRINYDVLRVELARRDLNRRKMADMAGLSLSTVYSITAGKRCSVETAQKIADALGVTVDEIKE